MRSAATLTLLTALTLTSALPQQHASSPPLPLLIWHGLGDRYDADGLHSVGELAKQIHPGTHVYYIRLDEDGSQDRSDTFLGNLTEQIAQVCQDVLAEPQLRSPAGGDAVRVDALGFSQGGQFLRGLVQRCDGLRVRSLVTFGSQHNGVADVKECGAWDFVCKGALALLRGNVWTDYVQGRVVPAQYFRTLNESTGAASDAYVAHSNFLADINNERKEKNDVYRARIAALENFVMYVFENDTTVIPRQSGWFAEVNMTSGDVTPLRDTVSYQEDWLGLKKLDEKNGLVFRRNPGDHMQLDEKILNATFKEYFGPETKGSHSQLKHICSPSVGLQWSSTTFSRFKAVVLELWRDLTGTTATRRPKEFL